ncbi:P-loop containing nucleoside triphosphate hydrolase protein [Mycena galopus ATCC 62051]|nr:P-loop containing nucleoside triphosphate hydrolase protein [Mycena galopus ATCC 62051]
MSSAGPSNTGVSRPCPRGARAQISSPEGSDSDWVTIEHPDSVPDSTILPTAGGRVEDSKVFINYVSGGQGGHGGGGGVQGHGGGGGTGEGPTLLYNINTQHLSMNTVHTSQMVVQASQILNHCPPPSRIFQGQHTILDAMHQFFAKVTGKQHIYVLYGLGGAGKTQIALKFIDEFTSFTNRLLVDASSTETIETGLKNIALAKQIGNSSQDGLRWLASQHEAWIMFLDNADNPKINLNQFFPKCNHGNVIITTRNPNLKIYGAHSLVSDLDESDAIALLLKSAMQDNTLPNELLAAEIVKVLWYLPLAIVQAGAFILESGSLDTYLALYSKSRAKLLSNKPTLSHDDYAWTVYTTWQMSFDKLSQPAAMFLQLCSFLHRDGISEDIFSRAASSLIQDQFEHKPKKLQKLKAKFRRLWAASQILPKNNTSKTREFLSLFLGPNGEWDSASFVKVTKEIMAYSLINFNIEQKSLSIHPLVHEWSQKTLADPDLARSCMGEILEMSILAIPYKDLELTSLRLVSHVDSLVQAMSIEVSKFGLQYAILYYHAGWLTAAQGLGEFVVQKLQKLHGDDHGDTLWAMNNLALTYCDLGQFQEAEKLQLVVLEKRRKLLGDDHLDTLWVMNNLANTYHNLGRFQEAEKLQLVVLEKQRKLLGDDHLKTLSAMNNLAATYDNLGRFSEAEKLKVVVLEKRRKFLGDNHPKALGAMNNLGCTYHCLGQLENAEELQAVAVEKQRKLFGDNHPDSQQYMRNLAQTYRRLDKQTEAEELEKLLMEEEGSEEEIREDSEEEATEQPDIE